MEIGRGLLRRHRGDVVGQGGVECVGCPLGRRAALDVEARHLPGRMHARIGAPGDRQTVRVVRENKSWKVELPLR